MSRPRGPLRPCLSRPAARSISKPARWFLRPRLRPVDILVSYSLAVETDRVHGQRCQRKPEPGQDEEESARPARQAASRIAHFAAAQIDDQELISCHVRQISSGGTQEGRLAAVFWDPSCRRSEEKKPMARKNLRDQESRRRYQQTLPSAICNSWKGESGGHLDLPLCRAISRGSAKERRISSYLCRSSPHACCCSHPARANSEKSSNPDPSTPKTSTRARRAI